MTTTYKTYPHNSKLIETAENETFRWNNNIDRDSLLHKPSGLQIYQGYWIVNGKMTTSVDDATLSQAMAFWRELKAAQEAPQNTAPSKSETREIENTDWYHINEFGERELNEDY